MLVGPWQSQTSIAYRWLVLHEYTQNGGDEYHFLSALVAVGQWFMVAILIRVSSRRDFLRARFRAQSVDQNGSSSVPTGLGACDLLVLVVGGAPFVLIRVRLKNL